MVFSSLTFLYLFLPTVMLAYCIVPAKARNAVLLLASMTFYFCGEQLYLLLMLGEIALAYVAGRLAEPRGEGKSGRGRKAVLVIFLVLSLGLLALFKYADLLPETVNAIAGREVLGLLRLPLPIGISFYIFQGISYGIDVYRGRYPAEKNPVRLALYISFFPQLIAGPIVRYDALRESLAAERKISIERLERGLVRFCTGLGKKLLIADRLFALCEAAAAASSPSVVLAWAEGLAFLMYVYYDFSGYSDMAIGLAGCFGFDIPENFRYPLISGSFREFWRRWHISLGTWFRDYLYIPLGGNRKGRARHLRNLLIVWGLTGLWHGASWNFVIWGACFGVLLILETAVRKKETARPRIALRIARTAVVLVVTTAVFVWFRFTEFSNAVSQFGRMFGTVALWSRDTAYLLSGSAVLLACALLGATPLPKRAMLVLTKKKGSDVWLPILETAWILGILLFATAYLVDGSFSPFLYFRF